MISMAFLALTFFNSKTLILPMCFRKYHKTDFLPKDSSV